jgi:hypothetical protein
MAAANDLCPNIIFTPPRLRGKSIQFNFNALKAVARWFSPVDPDSISHAVYIAGVSSTQYYQTRFVMPISSVFDGPHRFS